MVLSTDPWDYAAHGSRLNEADFGVDPRHLPFSHQDPHEDARGWRRNLEFYFGKLHQKERFASPDHVAFLLEPLDHCCGFRPHALDNRHFDGDFQTRPPRASSNGGV